MSLSRLNNGLTPLQSRFVEEYIIDENPRAAATRAGYSVKTAEGIGYGLLKHPIVKAEIEFINKDRIKKLGITKDRVLQELALIAFANVTDILTQDEGGNTVINLKYLPKRVTAAIAEVNIETSKGKTTVTRSKLKLSDKLSALDKIGKYLGMWQEKVEVTGTLTLEQLVEHSFNDNKEKEPEADFEGDVQEVEQITN